MTFDERRKMNENAEAVRALSARVDALAAYVEAIEARKRGRPSREDEQKMEALRTAANG